MEATTDPGVVIEARKVAADGTPFVVYATRDGSERWVIAGTCNQCGQCEVGQVGDRPARLVWVKPVGEPGACIDLDYGTRPDMPVRPEIGRKMPACSLRGRYITGGLHLIGRRQVAADVVDRDVPRTLR